MSKPDPRIVFSDQLDRLNAETLPANSPLKPPSYGSPQRDAIGSVIDSVVGDISRKIGELRETLDRIEQQALESAAKAKGVLSDHIGVCVKLNDEVTHMQAVVAEIKDQMTGG